MIPWASDISRFRVPPCEKLGGGIRRTRAPCDCASATVSSEDPESQIRSWTSRSTRWPRTAASVFSKSGPAFRVGIATVTKLCTAPMLSLRA